MSRVVRESRCPGLKEVAATVGSSDDRIAAVLDEACRLVGVAGLRALPEGERHKTSALPQSVCEALARTLPSEDAPTARAAWLAAVYDALLHEREPRKNGSDRTRASGVHYTPAAVARELAHACLSPLLDAVRTREDLLTLRILEPAAGAGAFVCAAVSLCAERLVTLPSSALSSDAAAKPTRLEAAQMVLREGVVQGLERDPWAVAVARRVLALTFDFAEAPADEFETLTSHLRTSDALHRTEASDGYSGAYTALPRENVVFGSETETRGFRGGSSYKRETTQGSPVTRAPSDPRKRGDVASAAARAGRSSASFTVSTAAFDAVVTNPPFVFARALPERTRRHYQGSFEMARHGQWDLCWLFAEAALTGWLRRDGRARLGLLLPEAVLARDESVRLRRFLVERVCELEVWPLGLRFARAQTGIIALTATTATHDIPPHDEQFVIHTTNESEAPRTVTQSLAALRRTPHHRFVAPLQPEVPEATEAVPPVDGATRHAAPTPTASATPSTFRANPATTDALPPAPRCRPVHAKAPHALSLGDVIRIRRGDEVGKRSLTPATPNEPCPAEFVAVLTGASLAVPLAKPQPTHWMPRTLAKKPAAQFAPPTVVVAKTGRDVHASVETHGLRCLQSVYTLRLTANAPDWLTHELLCALLVAEGTQARWIRPVTASKFVFPQITQSLLKSVALPPKPPPEKAMCLQRVVAKAQQAPVAAKRDVDKLVAEWLLITE